MFVFIHGIRCDTRGWTHFRGNGIEHCGTLVRLTKSAHRLKTGQEFAHDRISRASTVAAGKSMKSLVHRLFAVVFLLLLAEIGSAADSAETLIAKGKVWERKFKADEALPLYLAAEKIEPKNPDLLVRIARTYRYLMTDAADAKEKLRLGHLALDYSTRAAECGPKDCDAQLAPAITLGKMLPYMPTKEQVSASPKIKEAVDKALEIDPRNDNAWHILGRWNRVLAEISGAKRFLAGMIYGDLPKGSYEEAERAMKKAIALNPNRLMHYIELGRIYAQMGRKDEAKELINKGLGMPDAEKDDPETKQRARETLAKL
jgi:tetratricopeptide (TPR) repeat protein